MIGLDLLLSIPLLVAETSAHNVRGACLGVQNICAAATGERRTSAPTRRAATFNSETTEADDHRPNLLALAEAGFDRLEIVHLGNVVLYGINRIAEVVQTLLPESKNVIRRQHVTFLSFRIIRHHHRALAVHAWCLRHGSASSTFPTFF